MARRPNYTREIVVRMCLQCGERKPMRRSEQCCSDECRHIAQRRRTLNEHELSAGQIDKIMDDIINDELRPPWERHPQPWS